MARGTLFLVVGPSGAGKDTLIAAARERLPAARYAFPARTITRPRDAAGENHTSLDDAAFETAKRAGSFALTWQAHGLNYGIPISIAADLAAGRHVVINVSRTVVETAREQFAPAKVILITAPSALLSERLQARGRETSADISERLSRHQSAPADTTIVNDSALETAITAFLHALTAT